MQNPTKKTLRRPPNAEVRPREFLDHNEMARLIEAAKTTGRNGNRDAGLIMMLYNHGLRVNECVALLWSDCNFESRQINIRRMKNGEPSTHGMIGREMRLLREIKREQNLKFPNSKYIFLSQNGKPLSDHSVRKIVEKAGENAGFNFKIHPQMMRHSCGYHLASKGFDLFFIQHYLGHKNIANTVKYTQRKPKKSRGFYENFD